MQPNDPYFILLRKLLYSPPSIFADAHQEIATFDLPNDSTSTLLKRTKSLTVEETEAAIDALCIFDQDTDEPGQDMNEMEESTDDETVKDIPDSTVQLPNNDVLTNEIEVRQAIDTAHHLLNAGETTRTIELLNRIPPDVENVNVHVLLCKAYGIEGNQDKAISACERALDLDPQQYWANHFLARIYVERQDWEKVVQYAQEAFDVAPDDKQRVNNGTLLARAWAGLGDRENACALLEQIQPLAEQDDTRVENLRERFECQK
jgi:tetratricopeptide (TPR) repeat protein